MLVIGYLEAPCQPKRTDFFPGSAARVQAEEPEGHHAAAKGWLLEHDQNGELELASMRPLLSFPEGGECAASLLKLLDLRSSRLIAYRQLNANQPLGRVCA